MFDVNVYTPGFMPFGMSTIPSVLVKDLENREKDFPKAPAGEEKEPEDVTKSRGSIEDQARWARS